MRYLTCMAVIVSMLMVLQCEAPKSITSSYGTDYEDEIVGTVVVDEADVAIMEKESLLKGEKPLNSKANEKRLKYLAKGLAILINDAEIGRYLKDEIGKKFDGDYNALWEVLANKEFPRKGKLKKIIKKLYRTNHDMSKQLDMVPLLQVAAPVHFDVWDPNQPILVAYNPITKDDKDWEEITAFDGKGKKHKLDAKVEPAYPVLVISLNERVNPITGAIPNAGDLMAREEMMTEAAVEVLQVEGAPVVVTLILTLYFNTLI